MNEGVAFFLFLSVGAASLFSFIAIAIWAGERRREREAYYRSETIKKAAESSSPESTLEFLRERDRVEARRVRAGLQLSGLIMVAAGVGVIIFLRPLIPSSPIYLSGVIPVCVGVAMLGHSAFLAPKD